MQIGSSYFACFHFMAYALHTRTKGGRWQRQAWWGRVCVRSAMICTTSHATRGRRTSTGQRSTPHPPNPTWNFTVHTAKANYAGGRFGFGYTTPSPGPTLTIAVFPKTSGDNRPARTCSGQRSAQPKTERCLCAYATQDCGPRTICGVRCVSVSPRHSTKGQPFGCPTNTATTASASAVAA